MTKPPIALERRTLVKENAVFSVYSDHVRDAGGGEVEDYLSIVPRHRTADKVSGVAVLPVLEDRFGLIRVYRYPLGEYCWEVARGFVDSGETPMAAAARELREETGLVAGRPMVNIGVIAPEPGVIDAKVALFAAPQCVRDAAGTQGEMGHGELRFYTRDELASLVQDGGVLDPCSLIILLRYLGVGTVAPA